MNKIISDLLDYARPIQFEPVETNIRQLIRSTILTMDVPETIDVSIAVPEGLRVLVDSPLIRWVFINLFMNAIQTMSNGGVLRITVSKTASDVLIRVEDTGIGIYEENPTKIFHPLFTTKAQGQGFGLPVCKRIVDAHGGVITFKSKVCEGTTVTVIIPQQATGK